MSNSQPHEQVDALIVGAGISGLTAAHQLARSGRDVLVLEASDRPGGSIRTDQLDGFIVERGPNSVRMTDELEALVIDLELVDELVAGDPRAPRYIFFRGRLHAAPAGPGALFTTPLLSAGGKLRVFAEPFIGRPGHQREQTIAEFVTRRFGRQIHDVFVSAFVSGIYAGDTTKLSMEAVFPKLVELEREHGGVVRGGIASILEGRKKAAPVPGTPRKRRRPITISSFRGGLSRLPEAIGERLGESLRLEAPVERIERAEDGFVIGSGELEVRARELFIATPADRAATLLRGIAPEASAALEAIEYAPLASVSVAYRNEDVSAGREGFGFLAPRDGGLRTLGAIFGSSLFEGRAPEGWSSFTCFIGGALDPGALDMDDDGLVGQIASDLERAIGARGAPRVLGVTRWRRAIPQYTLGHGARVAAAEAAAATAGVRLLGNYLRGVSVGECVALARQAVTDGRSS